jgi:O-antigen/teichoic acid export membrane protein
VFPSEPYIYGVAQRERAAALDRLLRFTGFAIGGAAVVLTMLGPELVAVLGPASYAEALEAVPWLTFAAVSRAVTRVVALGAGLEGKTRVWSLAAACELSLATPMLLLALPIWGVTGAGLARFCAAQVALVVAYVLLRRLWLVRLPVLTVLLYVTVASTASAVLATRSFDLLAPIGIRIASMIALVGAAYLVVLRRTKAARILAARSDDHG